MSAALAVPQWTSNALCAETDPELFFPEKGGNTRPAKDVCRRCPVVDACLQYALDVPVDGIWGGTSVNDRKELARAAGRTYNTVVTSPLAGPDTTTCGTPAAAKRHQRRGERCAVCRVGLEAAQRRSA